MPDSPSSGLVTRRASAAGADAINIVQRGNLKSLEQTLRRQWRMGQSIVLCWSADERGVLVIFVPHYYLGNYCAVETGGEVAKNNEAFIRGLISGSRRKSREELFNIAARLDTAPTFIKLDAAISEESSVVHAVEQLIKRYGLSYVNSRAVILLDIAEFSLYTPFEQASQLNSCSYSMNSAYNKLLSQGIEINFARTTTGDGYYVWNRDLGPYANQDLFFFLLLVLADNAIARSASKGNTVPVLRSAYHIGSHYELYQAEGINPTVFSYIVGDVTIELARMLDLAKPNQILVGDFSIKPQGRRVSDGGSSTALETPAFVRSCSRELASIQGVQMAGNAITTMSCSLTENAATGGAPQKLFITDKHGISHHAYNLQAELQIGDEVLELGLDSSRMRGQAISLAATERAEPVGTEAQSTEAMLDDLASMFKKRSNTRQTEE